jgi:hypothetical protein
MKKLLFAVCALAAISLLAPSAGFATPDPGVWNNRIGFYTTATADAASLPSMAATTPFNVYMVVCNPTGADGLPAAVDAFECSVSVTGPSYFRLTETLGGTGALDVDSATNGYAVGFAAPIPPTNGFCLLVTWNCMLMAPASSGSPWNMYMGPASIPSVPGGYMAVNVPSSDPMLQSCLPSSGDFAQAVFSIGETVVPDEDVTFGAVKALFR